MSRSEFESLTLAELEALEERRAFKIRHARFNAALITAALINANRATQDADPVSPFDFIAGMEIDPEEAEREKLRRSIKHAVALAFSGMKNKTPEEIQAEKAKMCDRMRANGVEDPEELIREVFPEL